MDISLNTFSIDAKTEELTKRKFIFYYIVLGIVLFSTLATYTKNDIIKNKLSQQIRFSCTPKSIVLLVLLPFEHFYLIFYLFVRIMLLYFIREISTLSLLFWIYFKFMHINRIFSPGNKVHIQIYNYYKGFFFNFFY